VADFGDAAVLERYRRAAAEARRRFPQHPQPVLHSVVDSLLTGCAGACVLLGLRNPAQVEAAAHLGEPLSGEDAAAIRRAYAGEATT
jgi:hypothetical protein